ncbi:hydroxyacid dehydrogenase [Mesorhizobium sp. WSM4307]|uniref:hydroxyacid dehydrogenase n=1 Tax=unclassified Mesorhizobium TaxID=325217 RepID=UPI000BB0C2EA|nr:MULTISPECIES: hydroxyacid dehydrogenase [unclassified Mesorhizobium]PBB24398.1 3-phosphoglycerate dehydrogenase [Mesorhizobium sp. WSM4304]PBB74634.1 3-phosphoglycerate dehydrogenase [Mesorhizobium sp. WSM4308]TRC73199.1 hydroxyacid dehydrogenase [Mesorhizobium sp. WSM4315]TRC83477.1 hydroxyacid dehydrogenase [Mesorhizobium sp. WSM4307]
MPHVLIAGRLHPSGIALLDATPGVTYDYVEDVSEPSYAPLIDQAEGLVLRTQPLSGATVARASKLRIVSRHGVGYDAVDLPSLNSRGIALAIVGDVNSVSVAEHAMMLLLAASKRLVRADKAVRDGNWGWRNSLEAQELFGKRLLIIGYGRIGRHLARMAAAFGMEVRAHDPLLSKQGWPDGSIISQSNLAQGLAWADAVSVNVPKADEPVIGAGEIAVMKRSAILINTARGGVVDEVALGAALRDGRIGAAGLDVFDDEPPPLDHPLFGLDQVILTPHIAGLTAECGERMAVSSVQNVLDFFAGKIDPTLVVNDARLNGR